MEEKHNDAEREIYDKSDFFQYIKYKEWIDKLMGWMPDGSWFSFFIILIFK